MELWEFLAAEIGTPSRKTSNRQLEDPVVASPAFLHNYLGGISPDNFESKLDHGVF